MTQKTFVLVLINYLGEVTRLHFLLRIPLVGMTGVRLDRLVDRELRVLINLGDTSDPYFTYQFINYKDLLSFNHFLKKDPPIRWHCLDNEDDGEMCLSCDPSPSPGLI